MTERGGVYAALSTMLASQKSSKNIKYLDNHDFAPTLGCEYPASFDGGSVNTVE